MSNTILLIDGSSLAFLHANKPNYKETVKNHIETLLKKYNTTKYLIVLENSKSNFRNKVAVTKEYKGHRRTEKNKQNIQNYLPYLKDVFTEIKNTYKPITCYGMENDDVIAILATRLENCVMLSNDKDMFIVPGFHHNLKTNKTLYITNPGDIKINNKGKIEATGYYQAYYQILRGSPKENYLGLKGYGEKKVFNILKELTSEEEMQQKCIELFKEVYQDEGIKKLKEGFKLCWVIQKNNYLITPNIIDYKNINPNFK